MKNLFALIITISLMACGTGPHNKNFPKPEEIIRKSAEVKLQELLNDPKSYEFVSLSILDTIRIKDNLTKFQNSYKSDLAFSNSMLKIETDRKNDPYLKSYYKSTEEEKYKEEITHHLEHINRIDSIVSAMGEKTSDPAAFLYLLKFRSKNAFGALVIGSVYLQTLPDYSIINMTSEEGKLFAYPGEFPEYDALKAKKLL